MLCQRTKEAVIKPTMKPNTAPTAGGVRTVAKTSPPSPGDAESMTFAARTPATKPRMQKVKVQPKIRATLSSEGQGEDGFGLMGAEAVDLASAP